MGIVQKEFKNEEFDCEISVDSHADGEYRDLHKNISLDINTFDRYTPHELMNLARWITEKALDIKYTFDSEGFPKNKDDFISKPQVYGSSKFIDELERAIDETIRTSDR